MDIMTRFDDRSLFRDRCTRSICVIHDCSPSERFVPINGCDETRGRVSDVSDATESAARRACASLTPRTDRDRKSFESTYHVYDSIVGPSIGRRTLVRMVIARERKFFFFFN